MFALILAGGQGERLRPFTDTLPKPMVAVGGRPILWHQVRSLAAAGVTDVVFLTGYLGEAVSDYFGDGGEFGIRARYSREDVPLGRGGALKRGLALITDSADGADGPVLAANGDVITDVDPGLLVADYRRRRSVNPAHAASILTVPMVSPFGIVDADGDGVVRRFREKCALPYSINGGIYALDPAIRDLLPERGDHETSTFPALAAEGRMSAVPANAFWRSVDSLKDLREVDGRLAGRLAPAAEGADS